MSKRMCQWQAKFRNWVGGDTYGAMCVGIRRRGRGEWRRPIDASEQAREFLALKQTPGAGIWFCEDFKTIDRMHADHSPECRTTLTKDGLLVWFRVEEPRDLRPVPCHSMIRRLLKDLGEDSLYRLYKAAYKHSTSGVSLGFLIAKDGGAEWVYCDSLSKFGTFAEMIAAGYEVVACAITGYVEGWDGELSPHIIESTRDRPATADDFWRCLNEADGEAGQVWDDTHGCEACGSENEYGNRSINPHCEKCKGQGVII